MWPIKRSQLYNQGHVKAGQVTEVLRALSVQAGWKLGRAAVRVQRWSPSCSGEVGFVLLRPSTDWVRLTHTRWVNGFTQSPLIYMLTSPEKHFLSNIQHDACSNAMLEHITNSHRNDTAMVWGNAGLAAHRGS